MWIVPSRERPHRVRRFLDSLERTQAQSPVLMMVDRLDPTLGAYERLPCELLVVPGETVGLAGKVLEAHRLNPDREFYGILPDDCEAITPGWDRDMIALAVTGKVVYCRDGLTPPKRALPCIGGELVDRLGWLLPPGGPHHYGTDKLWKRLATSTGRLRWMPEHEIRLTDRVAGEPPSTWDAPKRHQKARQQRDKELLAALFASPAWRQAIASLR